MCVNGKITINKSERNLINEIRKCIFLQGKICEKHMHLSYLNFIDDNSSNLLSE